MGLIGTAASLNTETNAQLTLAALTDDTGGSPSAINTAIGVRARLSSSVQVLQNYAQINATAASSLNETVSSILNIDVAETVSKWVQEQVIQQGQQAVMSQAASLARPELQFYQRL
jgi:flagellin-like hook-associated protein FlgL